MNNTKWFQQAAYIYVTMPKEEVVDLRGSWGHMGGVWEGGEV